MKKWVNSTISKASSSQQEHFRIQCKRDQGGSNKKAIHLDLSNIFSYLMNFIYSPNDY